MLRKSCLVKLRSKDTLLERLLESDLPTEKVLEVCFYTLFLNWAYSPTRYQQIYYIAASNRSPH